MYRTIAVHVAAEPGAAARIRFAADLARRFDARLIGIAAALPRPPLEAITAGVMDATFLELELDQIAEEFKLVEQQFRTFAAEAGVKIEWRARGTFPTLALAGAASGADLLVVGRGLNGFRRDDYRTINPGDLVMRAGRAVLVAPSGATVLEARSVLVAWKNTRETRRAMADAMPFLKRAEVVNLVEVRETDEAYALDDPAAFLAAHGVNCRAESAERDAMPIEDQLMAIAARSQTDLIVAGGYGHTRIREWVFGGVTRSLISSCPVSCLLSH
jgi:nucleotide-binding universal stress UspA family protein